METQVSCSVICPVGMKVSVSLELMRTHVGPCRAMMCPVAKAMVEALTLCLTLAGKKWGEKKC